ncbi:MAG: lytic murein transglycosylase [Methylophilaceae bacterium]
MFRFLFLSVLFFGWISVFAGDDPTFSAWLEELKLEASTKGISEQTIASTFDNAQFLPHVIVLDRSQPEFISTFLTYVKKRVTLRRIVIGRLKLRVHNDLLSKIEMQYGVPKNILVAFWGLETNYGASTGNYGLPSALMTLAYEGRRAAFFRSQLMDMMHIVDAGHNHVGSMRGSWAGAMGHMQFMPSTFLAYAADTNADGRNDVWHSLPDSFASAANYLSSIGWVYGEPVAIEVKLPPKFDYYQAQLAIRKNTKYWAALGVKQANGSLLPKLNNTAILMPQGWEGPAFLVATNFDKVMQWNRSINYALSVSHLADQLLGDRPIVHGLEAENTPISFNQAWALQAKLNQLGYNSGKPDGFPGRKTKEAVRSYQLEHHLPIDGYPSIDLFEKVMKD